MYQSKYKHRHQERRDRNKVKNIVFKAIEPSRIANLAISHLADSVDEFNQIAQPQGRLQNENHRGWLPAIFS